MLLVADMQKVLDLFDVIFRGVLVLVFNKLLFFDKHVLTHSILASYNRCVRAPGVRMLESVGMRFLSSPVLRQPSFQFR